MIAKHRSVSYPLLELYLLLACLRSSSFITGVPPTSQRLFLPSNTITRHRFFRLTVGSVRALCVVHPPPLLRY
ncbi:hypothetical protein HD554DRAFT_2135038 [Boletus coccyginus]|nr:hypothetical protein HD554DRAFT_2135038 [Boletus coccyginus]